MKKKKKKKGKKENSATTADTSGILYVPCPKCSGLGCLKCHGTGFIPEIEEAGMIYLIQGGSLYQLPPIIIKNKKR